MMVIGLAGKSGSGKTTTAQMISDWCSANYVLFFQDSFARKLKEVCNTLFGWTDAQMDDQGFKSGRFDSKYSNMTRRDVMESLGTGWGRCKVRKSLWVDFVHDRMKKVAAEVGSNRALFLVTDVRFNNEASMIRSCPNSKIIHLGNSGVQEYVHVASEDIDLRTETLMLRDDTIIGFLKYQLSDSLDVRRQDFRRRAQNWVDTSKAFIVPPMIRSVIRSIETELVFDQAVLKLASMEPFFRRDDLYGKLSLELTSLVIDGLALALENK